MFFLNTLNPFWDTHGTGRINLKIPLGYDINFLCIWPFVHHPWFPTRKASKLTFVCFQLQLFSPCIVFNNWSWKQINVSFEQRVTLLHYSWLLCLVIFKYPTPFCLAALIGHLWLWQRLLGADLIKRALLVMLGK